MLMARRPDLREHVDAHQRQILEYLVQRGLAAAEDALGDGAQLRR